LIESSIFYIPATASGPLRFIPFVGDDLSPVNFQFVADHARPQSYLMGAVFTAERLARDGNREGAQRLMQHAQGYMTEIQNDAQSSQQFMTYAFIATAVVAAFIPKVGLAI